MKMNFDNFQLQKWMSQTVRAERADQQNGLVRLVSFFPSWIIVFKLTKIVHFLQTCADLSKKSKSIEATIYINLKDLVMLRK